MSHTDWQVLPHEELEHLETNLWSVEGDLPKMKLKRRMTILKQSDGRLIIHNGICLKEEAMKEIEDWGTPTYLLVPNGYHRLDAAAYKARYPEIKVFCPKGALEKVKEKVEVDGTYDQFPQDLRVEIAHLDGVKEAEGFAKIYHGPDKGRVTLVCNDVLFNHPHLPGFDGLLMRLLGSTGGPKITRIARWFLIKDKAALKAHLLKLADTPGLCRIIVGHGQHIEQDPADTLRTLANTL